MKIYYFGNFIGEIDSPSLTRTESELRLPPPKAEGSLRFAVAQNTRRNSETEQSRRITIKVRFL